MKYKMKYKKVSSKRCKWKLTEEGTPLEVS